jgi:hypothetical protein
MKYLLPWAEMSPRAVFATPYTPKASTNATRVSSYSSTKSVTGNTSSRLEEAGLEYVQLALDPQDEGDVHAMSGSVLGICDSL